MIRVTCIKVSFDHLLFQVTSVRPELDSLLNWLFYLNEKSTPGSVPDRVCWSDKVFSSLVVLHGYHYLSLTLRFSTAIAEKKKYSFLYQMVKTSCYAKLKLQRLLSCTATKKEAHFWESCPKHLPQSWENIFPNKVEYSLYRFGSNLCLSHLHECQIWLTSLSHSDHYLLTLRLQLLNCRMWIHSFKKIFWWAQ